MSADDRRAAPPAFAARRLTVEFPGGVRALRGVDLTVGAGEILGLVGESGSGKSVLGLSALGLLPAAARAGGQALLAGTDMVTADARRRRLTRKAHAGAVFQDPMTSLNPTKRIGDQLLEVTGAKDLALALLSDVNIPSPDRRFGQFPHELSGGMRQRVMIAMAIARNPTLVVADEPTTALDVTIQAEVVRLFRKLRDRRGVAVLFITHDLALAATVCDRLAVLYGGRIAEIGPTRDVIANPRHPYTAALLATRLSLTADTTGPLPTLRGEPPDPRAHRDECPFIARCALAAPECSAGLPELRSVGADRFDACVRTDEISDGAVPLPRGTTDHVYAATLLIGSAHTGPARTRWFPTSRRSLLSAVDPSVPALVVSGLTKAFGGFTAVDSVSFEIRHGRALALVGESGCGKTTTLRMVVGLERADRGTVRISGRTRPQMIFQDVGASLTPWLRVGDVLTERLRIEGVPHDDWAERVRVVLRLTGLPPDVTGRRPAQLSGGQRQRVALARAVIVPPRLLVCDEPTSALDVSLAATVLNLLNRLRAELDMAVLLVTHDFAVAKAAADDIAVMRDGAIVEHGPIGDVLSAPATEHTRRLLAAVPEIEA